MRRLTRTVAVSLVAAALAATAGCGGSGDSTDTPAGAPDQVTYLTGFGTFGREAYVYLAKEKGFFRDAGIDVTIKPGAGSGANIGLVVGGQAQFAAVDFSGVVIAHGTGDGKAVRAVAAIHQRTLMCVMTVEGNNINGPKDLEGKTIGDAPGAITTTLFPTYAKLAGVDPKKVKFVQQPPPQMPAALASGSVQAIGQYVVGKPTIEAAAKGRKAVTLAYSDYLSDLYGNTLVTTADYATQNPDVVRRFTAALLKGLTYSVENPREAAEILGRAVPEQSARVAAAAGELELMRAYVGSGDASVPVGAMDSQRVARSIAILQGAGAVAANLTPEQMVAFDLVPKG